MKNFEDEVIERKEIVRPKQTTKTEAIKVRMTSTLLLTRPKVQEAVKDWLLSFPSPMTKQELLFQLKKLSEDDLVAFEQLELSKGIRVLEGLPAPKAALLTVSLEEEIQETGVIALVGNKKARDKIIFFAEDNDLKVLDVDMLITQCPTANVKGRVPQILQAAANAEILPIVGLEKIKSLNHYLKSALDSLIQVRSDDKSKRTILSWTPKNLNQLPLLVQVAKVFEVK